LPKIKHFASPQKAIGLAMLLPLGCSNTKNTALKKGKNDTVMIPS